MEHNGMPCNSVSNWLNGSCQSNLIFPTFLPYLPILLFFMFSHYTPCRNQDSLNQCPMPINAYQKSGIDPNVNQCEAFRINAMIFIGIDRDWALIWKSPEKHWGPTCISLLISDMILLKETKGFKDLGHFWSWYNIYIL